MKESDRRALLFPLLLFSLLLFFGCSRQPETTTTPTPTATATGTPTPGASATGQAVPDLPGMDTVSTVAAAPTRTPEPTATPDAVTQAAEAIAQESGLAGTTLFGLTAVDWFNLAASLLIVVAAYTVMTWTLRWLLPRLLARAKLDQYERLVQVVARELRLLVVVLTLRYATARLDFIGAGTQTFLGDVYFLLVLGLSIVIVWRAIDLLATELAKRARKSGNRRGVESLITLLVWALRLIILIIATPIVLNHFGINITGFAVVLGVITLTISLAGRDVLADIIAGALILIDRPYRVGDRVGLGAIEKWGDVVAIGMISTKVLTVDGRIVIVPNSKVRQDVIENYSYPDPSYYDTTDIGVAFDNDVERVEQLLADAAGSVDGVQQERGIDTRLESFARDEMIFRVGWWMEANDDYYKLRQLVNRAIIKTFKEAGVSFPYQKEHVRLEPNTDSNEIPGKSSEEQ